MRASYRIPMVKYGHEKRFVGFLICRVPASRFPYAITILTDSDTIFSGFMESIVFVLLSAMLHIRNLSGIAVIAEGR